MTENFTYAQVLIRSITNESWFANPAGIEGNEVVILEKVGDGGSRYYTTLKPGQTLRFGERIFSKYDALAVDMRFGRTFQISGQFSTRDRGRKVSVTANIRYHVTDANVLTLKVVDPLGELRDKVIAALNRDLVQYPEGQINANLIEKIVRNVGPAPHLGLAIEDVDVAGFDQDSGVTEHVRQLNQAKHDIDLQELKNKAELLSKQQQNDADILMRQARHDNIQLTDINVLMHEHPDLVQQVFSHFAARDQTLLQSQLSLMAPVIKAYISQKEEEGALIDPEDLAKIIQRTFSTTKSQLHGPIDSDKQISWSEGNSVNIPSEKPPLKFGNEEGDDNITDGRIKFGDTD